MCIHSLATTISMEDAYYEITPGELYVEVHHSNNDYLMHKRYMYMYQLMIDCSINYCWMW